MNLEAKKIEAGHYELKLQKAHFDIKKGTLGWTVREWHSYTPVSKKPYKKLHYLFLAKNMGKALEMIEQHYETNYYSWDIDI